MVLTTFIKTTHPEWWPLLHEASGAMDDAYIESLLNDTTWMPGPANLFAAFSQPISDIRYILLGESPYPRAASANGYAFWDNAVGSLWSRSGLSTSVNRATSLRNFIKMLLVARGDLKTDLSQHAIAALDKSPYVVTAADLFLGMLRQGFLLLNATLVFSEGKVGYHARYWRPFMCYLFDQLAASHPNIELILLGKVADLVPKSTLTVALRAEHPYNLSFITNPKVIDFFKPMDLLTYHE